MDKIIIRGGRPLHGTIPISGAKNAALPLIAASLLTDDTLRLTNLPEMADVDAMIRLTESLGAHAERKGAACEIRAETVTAAEAPYDLVRKMRASVLVMGPLLARTGRARVSLPGGCAIGARPVDLHLKAMEALGAEMTLEGGYIDARAPKGLKGAHFTFPAVTVGGTENLLMAAALADGETVIANAAREPEIADLARCLSAMGAHIEGAGGDTITVRGAARLGGCEHAVIPDRIEAGSYAAAAAVTGGDVMLTGVDAAPMGALLDILRAAGVSVTEESGGLRIARQNGPLRGVDAMTEPYPGFPTDLQAQLMALMTVAEGASMITEHIFENRFMHVPELARMGADVTVHGASAIVRGVKQLSGAPVMATDLRASMSLVLAGLAASGETAVSRVYHLDRGYERLVEKLAACGADIERRAE
ncbi:MAG: UDP-N-acetylglucosamine 1-carboxyvinyltransferase [Rhodospirillales bacterium]